MENLENLLHKLDEAIEFEDWSLVQQVAEDLRVQMDNPFVEYEKDEDIEDY